MNKTSFHLKAMDCPSEERMVRMKLADDPKITHLEFDLQNRNLVVWHVHEPAVVLRQLAPLKLGESLVNTTVTTADPNATAGPGNETKLLWVVLGINASFFLVELLAGWLGRSMGLVADSLDMLADALVYGMALFVMKASLDAKKKVARTSGVIQVILALTGFAEIVRRTLFPEEIPDFTVMIVVSALALAANGLCLFLLQKSRNKEVHLQATIIFTSNDVIINAGVIVAGILVMLTESVIPDLLIGSVVFLLVIRGAIRILRLS